MRTLYWDIETRSVVSLRECGANVYAMDPATQVRPNCSCSLSAASST
jgi:hypothetical protein